MSEGPSQGPSQLPQDVKPATVKRSRSPSSIVQEGDDRRIRLHSGSSSDSLGDTDTDSDQGDDDQTTANMAQQATPTQSLNVRKFQGAEGNDVQDFCSSVDRAMQSYGWTEKSAAGAAMSRMEGYASYWLRTQEEDGVKFDTWTTADTGLRAALIKRFYPKVTALMATDAMRDMHQKSDETCSMFHDRVKTAIQLMFKSSGAAFNDSAEGKLAKSTMLFNMFSAGLKESTRIKVFKSAKPPLNEADALEAARNVETEESNTSLAMAKQANDPLWKKLPGATGVLTTLAVSNQQGTEPTTTQEEQMGAEAAPASMDALVEAVSQLMKTKVKCFNCSESGHYARECKAPRRGGSNSNSRGRNNQYRQRGNSGQRGGNWRNRGSNQGGYQRGWQQPRQNRGWSNRNYVNMVQDDGQYGYDGDDHAQYDDYVPQGDGRDHTCHGCQGANGHYQHLN